MVVESQKPIPCFLCGGMGTRFNFNVKTVRGCEGFTVYICPHMLEQPMRGLSGEVWNIRDYRTMFSLMEEGMTIGMIAGKMGRTRKGVERKLERLREKTRYFKQLPETDDYPSRNSVTV